MDSWKAEACNSRVHTVLRLRRRTGPRSVRHPHAAQARCAGLAHGPTGCSLCSRGWEEGALPPLPLPHVPLTGQLTQSMWGFHVKIASSRPRPGLWSDPKGLLWRTLLSPDVNFKAPPNVQNGTGSSSNLENTTIMKQSRDPSQDLSITSPTLSWGQKPRAPEWRSRSLVPGFFPVITCRPIWNLIGKDNILAWWELARMKAGGRQSRPGRDPAGEHRGVIQTHLPELAPVTGGAHTIDSPTPGGLGPLPARSSKKMFVLQPKEKEKKRKHLLKGKLKVWSLTGKAPVLKIGTFGASLVAQWLRICLPMQGTRVRALVWEDPTCRGAARPVSHNYWACASGACAPQQERPR